ncbi:MAG TPA: HET-C-related protein, partial [Myxococcaceae bacterium]
MARFDLRLKELRDGVRLPTGQSHTITLIRRVDRVRLVGMFFDVAKCFLLPSAMHGLREVKRQYSNHPGSNLLVVGHTDTAGSDEYNLTLSLERADAMAAFLTDQVDPWEAFFGSSKPYEKRWGLLEVQHMLTMLPEGEPPFYGGTPNGAGDTRHREAVKAFQRANGLTGDGIAGPLTRKPLIKAYMALDGTSLPSGTTLTTHGCGEFFPVDETGDGKLSAENRRVEVFFFDGPIKPPPPGHTSARGSTEYPRWLKAVKQTVDVTLGTASAVAALKSRYALERFEQLASKMGKDDFVAWASFVYGTDIPVEAYRKLRDDLANKALAPPEIQLVPGGVDGKDGAYDDATQEIGVSEELALAAETDPPSAGKLIVVLMHEFGHHVDHLLRHHYSQVGGDAPDEEGAELAYGVTAMHHVDTNHVPFATLSRNGQDVELALDFPDFTAAVQQYLSDPQAQEDAKRETVEFFGAGRGNPKFPKASFGHRSIEDGLKGADPAFFTDPVRDQIYFGNWLRDFSQFNDPAWLRFLRNGFVNGVNEAKEVMTQILDLGAFKDFDPDVTPSAHVAGVFHVTTAKLGVYRPEEHIDNPEGIKDGSKIDPLFHGPVLPPEIAVDPNTGLKAYIATRGGGFKTAADFVDSSLRSAKTAGITPEGRRLFGQALHTLEDLFAHSNFVELMLIRLGHTAVYPWVGAKTTITVVRNGKPGPRIPMVTGVFGWVDTKISGGSAIGEALQHPIECKAGEFSQPSVAALKALGAITPDGARAVEGLFTQLHDLEKKYPDYATFLCRTTDDLREWVRNKMGTGLREEIKEEGKAEKDFFNDPNSTAPT